MSNQAELLDAMYDAANSASDERPRALARPLEREWLPLLARLPLAIATSTSAAQLVAIVARCIVPSIASAITVDRWVGETVEREHTFAGVGRGDVDVDLSAVERALRRARHELAGRTMVIHVPSAGARRAISLRGASSFTERDLEQADVLAQWLAFALSALTPPAEPAVDAIRAAAVHDLMNPLTVITVNAKGLRSVTAGAELDERLALIERSAKRMHDIAVTFLDDVRRATDRISLELAWVYADGLIEEAVEGVRDAARAREIGILVNSCDGLVLCDRTRIVQVLVNLLDNAVKYTERGGSVSVDATRVGNRTRITIADNGRGISPANVRRLFDRYWRSSPGTGIGLATARAFTSAHDSELQVTSVLGGGTTFWFDLMSAE